MASLLDVKKRVGHGGMQSPRKKVHENSIDRTGSKQSYPGGRTGDREDAARLAAQVLRAGHVDDHGILRSHADVVHSPHCGVRVCRFDGYLVLPDKMNYPVGAEVHRALATFCLNRIHFSPPGLVLVDLMRPAPAAAAAYRCRSRRGAELLGAVLPCVAECDDVVDLDGGAGLVVADKKVRRRLN